MNFSKRILSKTSSSIQPFACKTCSGSCMGSCSGGCDRKCLDGCKGECKSTCKGTNRLN